MTQETSPSFALGSGSEVFLGAHMGGEAHKHNNAFMKDTPSVDVVVAGFGHGPEAMRYGSLLLVRTPPPRPG